MPKWLFAALLLLQTHFAASFLVPLDAGAQREFGGLLRWAWPWSEGDSGPLGQVTVSEGAPIIGLFLAMGAGLFLVLAAMSLFGFLVPQSWWQYLTIAGAGLSILLMALFPGLTKLLPVAVAGLMIWFAVSSWSSQQWVAAAGD